MEKIYTHWILLDPSTKNIAWANKAFKRGYRYAISRIYVHPSGVDSVFEILSPDDWQHLQLDVESFSSPLRRTARKPSPLGNGSEVDRWEKIYGKLAAPRVKGGKVVFPLQAPKRNPGEPSQFEFHLKPSGWTGAPCPICGCATPNLRARHRALKADEAHRWGVPYIKRVKVSFGTDFSDEPLKE